MDSSLRTLTPVVLLVLAALAWFEPFLPAGLRATTGEVGVLRVVVGLLAVYTATLVAERQRMEATFVRVLGELKSVRDQARGTSGTGTAPAAPSPSGAAGDERAMTLDAVRILVAALSSAESEVRQNAVENLERLTGERLGDDVRAWNAYLERASREGGA